MGIDGGYKPLPVGTRAVIRMASQTGIANRYVELDMPGGPKKADDPERRRTSTSDATTTRSTSTSSSTRSTRPRARRSRSFFKGSAAQFQNVTAQANLGFQYLNPALSTSSRLFNELNRDTPVLEHFLGDSAHLVTAVAQKRDDLSALVPNLNTTTHAIGAQKASLADAIGRLPDFMRQANTTFVNVRSALDEVDPLVNASKPVAKKLKPFLDQVQPLAHDARPTVAALNTVISRSGADNDLIDLTNTLTPLSQIAVDTAQRDGASRDGSFPETTKALMDSSPIIAQGRPVHARSVRLVRRLLDHRRLRRPRQHLAHADHVQRVLAGHRRRAEPARRHQPLGPTRCSTSRSPARPALPRRQPASCSRRSPRTGQFRRCPGGGDVVAPDKSNVLSPEPSSRRSAAPRPTAPRATTRAGG